MPVAPHILIAHDHDIMRTLLVQMVVQIYPLATITAVPNGTEALNGYLQHGADLLITNNRMPGLDGADLIRALRARQAICPILMVSTDITIEAMAIAAGATRFLRTPFGFDEFRQALIALLPP
jgi:CheY-like chemotaxis protein